MNTYYVYVHIDPRIKEPFYIGKGCRKRAWDLRKRNPYHKHKLNRIREAGYSFEWKILVENLSESDALALEHKLIIEYKEKGVELTNCTESGQFVVYTEEIRERMRLTHLNQVPWNKGKSWSDETKIKIGLSSKGRKFSTEARIKRSESHSGEKHWGYGKQRSQETKDKLSAAIKLTDLTPRKILCTTNGIIYKSITQASRDLGCSKRSISKVLKGIQPNTKGFHFEEVKISST